MTNKFMTDPVKILVKRDELTLEVSASVLLLEIETINCSLCFVCCSEKSLWAEVIVPISSTAFLVK